VLPGHIVPSRFVFLDQFPYSQTGKIDRDRLPAPSNPEQMDRGLNPETATEASLAEFWADAFQLSDVGRNDDFFDLGGDSLIAAEIAAHVFSTDGVTLNLEAFAKHPTLAELAACIDALRNTKTDDAPPLSQAPRNRSLPLSFWEERTWITSRTLEQSAKYTAARPYRMIGPLNVDLLRKCMTYLAGRHEILRTTYAVKDGCCQRVVHRPDPVELEFIDVAGEGDPEQAARLLCMQHGAVGFDIVRGPLLKFVLIRLCTGEHWLLRAVHHITCDNATWDLYFGELALLYEAMSSGSAPPLPSSESLRYGDYAAWQRRAVQESNARIAASIEWWRENLAGAPDAPAFPFRRPQRRIDADPMEGCIYWGVDRKVSRGLDAIARSAGATPYMVRLAAFVAQIAVETGVHEAVLGSYVSMRDRVELQSMLGSFTNLVTLRIAFDPAMNFIELLSGVRAHILDVDAHCTVPYEMLCNEMRRQGANPPAINALFHISRHRIHLKFAGIELTALPRCESFMPWGFTLAHDANDEERRCRAIFDATIYDPVGVRAFVERYRQLLDAVSRQPVRAFEEFLGGRTAPIRAVK
jgi:acyl carrier protein